MLFVYKMNEDKKIDFIGILYCTVSFSTELYN